MPAGCATEAIELRGNNKSRTRVLEKVVKYVETFISGIEAWVTCLTTMNNNGNVVSFGSKVDQFPDPKPLINTVFVG